MNDFIERIQIFTSLFIGYISYLIGYLDNFLKLLIMFMIVDYITGFIKAKIEKKIDSKEMMIGGYKKILIFMVIIVANWVDITFNVFLRQTVIIYYIIQEWLSIIENIDTFIKLPDELTRFFKELNNKEED